MYKLYLATLLTFFSTTGFAGVVQTPDTLSQPKEYSLKMSGLDLLTSREAQVSGLKSKKSVVTQDQEKLDNTYKDWLLRCLVLGDGVKACTLMKNDLWIHLVNGIYTIRVGANHARGSVAKFQLDQSQYQYAEKDTGYLMQTSQIISELQQAESAQIWFKENGYASIHHFKIDLKNFTEAFKEMQLRYHQL